MASLSLDSVFISSTYEDLKEHRRAAWQVLEEFKATVKGMERFGARPESALQTCLAEVEASDVYVGIVGYRLGSLDAETGKSFTQLEYERARRLERPILIYLADDESAAFPYSVMEADPKRVAQLDAFKDELKNRHTVAKFSTPTDLADQLRKTLSDYLAPREPAASKAPQPDDFSVAAAVVARFMLVPKTVTGVPIRMKVRTRPTGDAFAASRSLCAAFNLEYGRTVGRWIDVVEPASRRPGSFTRSMPREI